jgi:predicted amidophosphoribosyltransferase
MKVIPIFCLECGRAAPCGLHPGGALVFAATPYSGLNREIVRVMKYKNGRSVALLMGRLLASRFGRPDANFLTPVPLHKRSERNYNQAELIARGAGSVWGTPVASVLEWSRVIARQAARSSHDGRGLPEGIMTARRPKRGGRFFIVDDVYTSGSTIRAAARALAGAGLTTAGAMVWSRSGG